MTRNWQTAFQLGADVQEIVSMLQSLEADVTTALAGGGGGTGSGFIPLSEPGSLATGTGVVPLVMPFSGHIAGVILGVNTAPTGQAILVDVNKSSGGGAYSTIYTTQANRPSVPASSTVGTLAVPDITAFVAGDRFTFDIDQIGSGTAGADLGISVYLTA